MTGTVVQLLLTSVLGCCGNSKEDTSLRNNSTSSWTVTSVISLPSYLAGPSAPTFFFWTACIFICPLSAGVTGLCQHTQFVQCWWLKPRLCASRMHCPINRPTSLAIGNYFMALTPKAQATEESRQFWLHQNNPLEAGEMTQWGRHPPFYPCHLHGRRESVPASCSLTSTCVSIACLPTCR